MFDETAYDRVIRPLYGPLRDADRDASLLTSNGALLPHAYDVEKERVDLTAYETYCIDPPGCEDADDAFSVFTETGGSKCLAIHIADPTAWISPDSELWRDVRRRAVTRYPSNRRPIHLMPEEIVRRASLDADGTPKQALTVLAELDPETYAPGGRVRLLFSLVRVNQSLTYEEAVAIEEGGAAQAIALGLKVAAALATRRADKGPKVRNSSVRFSSSGPELVRSDGRIEGMIAEFAIFANSFVARHIRANLAEGGIFRTCSAKDTEIDSSDFFVEDIVTNGIKAEYLPQCSAHDLVGAPEYCHFTSPIRRLADCACHYLVKYVALRRSRSGLPCPFSPADLETLSAECLRASKEVSKVQHCDTKFRLLQTLHCRLHRPSPSPARLTFFVSTTSRFPFLNLVVCGIDDHRVRLPYTLRAAAGRDFARPTDPRALHHVRVTRIGPRGRFDGGSLPELDAYVAETFFE